MTCGGVSRAAGAERAASLLGVHDANLSSPGMMDMERLFAGRPGWLVNTVYSTDIDWVGVGYDFNRARDVGFTPVVRVDYARPDGSAYASNVAAPGATIPPPGDVGWCLMRRDGVSRPGGRHLDCYLNYLRDLVPVATGVHTWLVGNEMNMRLEAKAFAGGVIDPAWYANVYREARRVIRSFPGHEQDAVFVGGLAPGTGPDAARFMSGRDFMSRLLYVLSPNEVDGIALHAYGGWPRVADNGGIPAMDVFENGSGGSMGYRTWARWIDGLGFSGTPLLITEMSVHVHRDQSDAPNAAQFILDAYRRLNEWNSGPSNHPVLGGVWFTWNDPVSFWEESLAQHNVGDRPETNPVKAFSAAAPTYGSGPLRAGTCVAPPGDNSLTPSNLFPQTGFHIAGLFRTYWNKNGGLAVFGYPLDEGGCKGDSLGRVLWSQWTERQRLEYHPEAAGSPYDIQLGLLGRAVAERNRVDTSWRSRAPGETRTGCEWMGPNDQFGHWVCGAILRYWHANGLDLGQAGITPSESLALFGYPITDQVPFVSGGRTFQVQWFERARLELHPENAPPYDVLGGLLGREAKP